MIIGVPREIKQDEHRVSLVPAGAYSLVKAGHQVLIEQGAGLGSGIPDAEYKNVGAQIVADRDELFAPADMIIKVKEPLASEYQLLRDGRELAGGKKTTAQLVTALGVDRGRLYHHLKDG